MQAYGRISTLKHMSRSKSCKAGDFYNFAGKYSLHIMRRHFQTDKFPSGHRPGIDILRIWMSYEVVLMHLCDFRECAFFPPLDIFRYCVFMAVPAFMFVSFLLTGRHFVTLTQNREYPVSRCKRLAVPIIFWSLVYLLVYLCVQSFFGVDFDVRVSDLLPQLFLGHAYAHPLWFLNVMLYLTLILSSIMSIKSYRFKTMILCALVVMSFVTEYTGLERRLVDDMSDEYKYPVGRLIEMMPYACVAILMRMHTKMLSPYFIAICIVLAVLCRYLLAPFHIFSLGYAGLPLFFEVIAMCLILCLGRFGFIRGRMKEIISSIASLTLGIFCVHVLMGQFLFAFILPSIGLAGRTLLSCLIVYLVSLLVSMGIYRMPLKYCREAVS